MREREKFLVSLFQVPMEFDWESKQVAEKAEALIQESSKLNIYKETSSREASFNEWLSNLEF